MTSKADSIPFDGAATSAPAKRTRKAAAPKAEVAPVATEAREFKTEAQVAAAFTALSGLLSDEQRATLRAHRSTVGGKMAAAMLLGITPKAK